MVRNYTANRRGFYEALLERLPDPSVRRHMAAAISLSDSDRLITLPASPVGGDFLTALGTLDLLKKPSYGSFLGRTTISVDEALSRAARIEEVGIILFSHLVETSPALAPVLTAEMESCKQSLANILELHDQLRYHKLSLNPPD